jgi:hypothetical protein
MGDQLGIRRAEFGRLGSDTCSARLGRQSLQANGHVSQYLRLLLQVLPCNISLSCRRIPLAGDSQQLAS